MVLRNNRFMRIVDSARPRKLVRNIVTKKRKGFGCSTATPEQLSYLLVEEEQTREKEEEAEKEEAYMAVIEYKRVV